MNFELHTDRLILRQWKDTDYASFCEMNRNANVMRYFPSALNKTESHALADRFRSLIEENSWGFWALELKSTGQFIGFTGLHAQPDRFSFSPCTETGWRLMASHWHKGYATEAATAALYFAFEQLCLHEIVSFTAVQNLPSQAVMKRLHMQQCGEFEHPALSHDSPLLKHVLYKITRADFLKSHGGYDLGQSVHILQA